MDQVYFWITHINWQTVANVATALALLVAAGAFIWQIYSHRQERRYINSSFALESARTSLDEAVKLLSDKNNDRITWIAAARILRRAVEISSKVTETVHVDVLEVQLERYRRVFGQILGFDDTHKNAAFFYGSGNPSADIEEAAKESTRSKSTSRGETPVLKALPEGALWTIWEFAQYPKDYEDPIKERFPDQQFAGPGMLLWPGLYDYLKHIREYRSANGKLIQRK